MRGDCPLNIVLIGMPGAGKSTVGVLLAKRLGYHFVDTDLLIQARAGVRLQEIIRDQGLESFKRMEEEAVCALTPHRAVVSTGGSVIYGAAAMAHLRQVGRLVYLDLPLDILRERIDNMDSRGLVLDPGESFADLYARRTPLYRQHAELTIAGASLTQDQIAARIEAALCGSPAP